MSDVRTTSSKCLFFRSREEKFTEKQYPFDLGKL